jgi:hypothetical protein
MKFYQNLAMCETAWRQLTLALAARLDENETALCAHWGTDRNEWVVDGEVCRHNLEGKTCLARIENGLS